MMASMDTKNTERHSRAVLRDWFMGEKITQSAAAEKIGISRPTFVKALHFDPGTDSLHGDILRRIESKTGAPAGGWL